MSDLPSQYAEEVETFRQILDLPDPRETMPRSSTTVLGLDNEKGQQELRPRGPSAMLPLNPILKDTFEKFEQDFLASNLAKGKYIKPPASTAKYYKVGQPCFEDKLQELNTDFAKICDYFELMNKRILIQQRALVCLSKSSPLSPEGTIYHGQHWPSEKRGRNDPPSTTSRGLETSRAEELALLAFSSLQVSVS